MEVQNDYVRYLPQKSISFLKVWILSDLFFGSQVPSSALFKKEWESLLPEVLKRKESPTQPTFLVITAQGQKELNPMTSGESL